MFGEAVARRRGIGGNARQLAEAYIPMSSNSIVHEPHTRPESVHVRMENVESPSIRRVGYNPETQQLVIHFHDSLPGLRTVYSPVPREYYEGLMASDCMGQYLHENIRYHFDFSLVEEDSLIDPAKAQQ